MNQLPIDVVPNTNPPRFKWRRSVNTMIGKKTVDCDGALPPQVEDSVRDVIALVRDQEREIERLREQVAASQKQIDGYVEKMRAITEERDELASRVGCDVEDKRIAASKRAEPPQHAQPTQPPYNKGRKGG